MKLIVHYMSKMGIAIELQSMVSLVFFLLFLFILYMVLRANNKEYKSYGNLPLDDTIIRNDFNSQEKN